MSKWYISFSDKWSFTVQRVDEERGKNFIFFTQIFVPPDDWFPIKMAQERWEKTI